MTTNAARYQTILDRDARYDGVFYFAVKTTGIFCRPSCPAARPLEKNVAFFETTAEAIKHGFRACKRCHPEDYISNKAVAALTASDATSVSQLAEAARISDRQLRRLTKQQLGMSPLEITQAKRIMTANNLLVQTKLPIIDVAYTSGYESLRQFNDVFKQRAKLSPRAYRKAHKTKAEHSMLSEPIDLTIRLPFKKPFQWYPLKKALLTHMIPGLENIDEASETMQRLIKTRRGYAKITLDLKEPVDAINAKLSVTSMEDVDYVVKIIKRVLDLNCDPAAVQQALGGDTLLSGLVAERPGLRVCGMFDPFELLINTIIGQQVSIQAARTFSARLVSNYGQKIDELYTFPSAEVLLAADAMKLYENTKLNHKKIAAIQAVSKLIVDGFDLSAIINRQSAKEALLSVKGIGPWTVEYVALRGYGDPDSFPADDLFIKRALNVKTAKDAEAIAEKWRPYRGYATMHLWTKGTYA